MTKILVLHTGGTISMSQNQAGDVTLNQNHPLNHTNFNELLGDAVTVVSEQIFNLPSAYMDPEHMLQLQQRILKAQQAGLDGVVVTHGTDTLEETAYFLDLTLPHNIAVVVTGAMRSSNEIGADGRHNFINAIRIAAAPAARNKGTLVALNDEIHAARFVTKRHTTSVATFSSPLTGAIGAVTRAGVQFFDALPAAKSQPITALQAPVYLIKAYAGMEATFLEAVDQPETKGLVVEALGSGNLPLSCLAPIQTLLNRDVPVIFVSRCYDGVAQPIYAFESGGVSMQKLGVTFCQGLNGQKARIRLIVGLSNGLQGDALAAYMQAGNIG